MTVIVAIRIGEGSRAAAEAARHLAKLLGADLRVLYVAKELEAVPELAAAARQSHEEVRARMIEEIRARCREEMGDELVAGTRLIVTEGNVAQAVSRVARELEAGLIVVGMKGRSALSRFVLGDTTSAVLENAPCPVVVIPPALFEGRAE